MRYKVIIILTMLYLIPVPIQAQIQIPQFSTSIPFNGTTLIFYDYEYYDSIDTITNGQFYTLKTGDQFSPAKLFRNYFDKPIIDIGDITLIINEGINKITMEDSEVIITPILKLVDLVEKSRYSSQYASRIFDVASKDDLIYIVWTNSEKVIAFLSIYSVIEDRIIKEIVIDIKVDYTYHIIKDNNDQFKLYSNKYTEYKYLNDSNWITTGIDQQVTRENSIPQDDVVLFSTGYVDFRETSPRMVEDSTIKDMTYDGSNIYILHSNMTIQKNGKFLTELELPAGAEYAGMSVIEDRVSVYMNLDVEVSQNKVRNTLLGMDYDNQWGNLYAIVNFDDLSEYEYTGRPIPINFISIVSVFPVIFFLRKRK